MYYSVRGGEGMSGNGDDTRTYTVKPLYLASFVSYLIQLSVGVGCTFFDLRNFGW